MLKFFICIKPNKKLLLCETKDMKIDLTTIFALLKQASGKTNQEISQETGIEVAKIFSRGDSQHKYMNTLNTLILHLQEHATIEVLSTRLENISPTNKKERLIEEDVMKTEQLSIIERIALVHRFLDQNKEMLTNADGEKMREAALVQIEELKKQL